MTRFYPWVNLSVNSSRIIFIYILSLDDFMTITYNIICSFFNASYLIQSLNIFTFFLHID